MKNRILSTIIRVCAAAFTAGALFMAPLPGLPAKEAQAYFDATLLVTKGEDEFITDEDRNVAYYWILDHMNTLSTLYDLSPDAAKRMNELWYEANCFIAETQLTVGQLVAYMNEVEANLTAAAGMNVPGANQFIFLTNDTRVPSGIYDQYTTVSLSVVNFGKTLLQDVIITPVVSTDPDKWPFKITSAQDTRKIYRLEPVKKIDEADKWSQTVNWNFLVSGDAKTGTYPLTFHVKYYRDGAIEETDLVTYANITGAPGNGSLSESAPDGKTSTPRIIVTGFSTDPAKVYAGDTFHLTINVQNTSATTAVNNIQFDLKAAKEGTGENTTYEAFLPTSGSATIFVSRIGAGQSADLNIEMTARSDLTQKPYVIDLDAAYEDDKNNPYTASTSVSIPVHQEARVDTGDAEILPSAVEVGGTVNVMYSIYNKGKTTLYNVQADFEGDSIEGGMTFVGKLDPGATGNVDAMLNAVAPTMDDGIVKAIVSFEDEAGNVTTIEKELTIFVYEPEYGEPDYGDWGDDMDMNEKKFPWGLLFGGILLIIAAGVVTGIIVGKRKKKKKAQAEQDALDDDIVDLDDDDDEDGGYDDV
ncbi:MAG: hypothetical protein IK115_07335 [Lachnospiraceae bacterium]|nr:hypothetical protein [Lachnospiraceae bacterium]